MFNPFVVRSDLRGMNDTNWALFALAGASANHFLVYEKVAATLCWNAGGGYSGKLLAKYSAQKSLKARTRGESCLLLGNAAATLTLANCHWGSTSTSQPCCSVALHRKLGTSEMPIPLIRPCKT